MNKLINFLRHPNHWVINVQLLILYVVSTALFFALYMINRSTAASAKNGVEKKEIGASLLVFALAAGSNFIGVATLVFLAKKLSTIPPLALVGLPFLLILEQHIGRIRSEPGHSRLHALGALGVTSGMALATWMFMRHSPIV